MKFRHMFLLFFASFCIATTANAAETLRLDTPSGYPVPRFVSLKYHETNCRSGPSKAHPVRFTFMKRGSPLIVVAETVDHWRKVKDRAGDECWAHKSVLRAPSHAFTTHELLVRARPNERASARGTLSNDLLVKVETRKNGWARISVDGLRGWVRESSLWGLAGEALNSAAHN